MRGAIRTIAALAILGALAGSAVILFGLYNVSARVGHWPGIGWVLHTTFRNSVELRAMPAEAVPDLSDPALVELGARHYDTACAPCHAAPGEMQSATMRAMLPAPPHITEAVADWQPNELHWIVLNGIKLSGMPAWPADRPEEVWPVVAYLRAIQDGMTAAQHASLVATPETSGGPPGAAWCQGCHGGVDRYVPRLDIQTGTYLAKALEDYRSGRRASGIMQQAASRLSPAAVEDFAEYFAGRSQPAGAAASENDEPGVEPGVALAQRGTEDVPACTACHGPKATRGRAEYPALAGQDRAYLATQLRLWREGHRGGSEIMAMAANDLSDDDIEALAEWYAALPATPPEGD